MATDEDHPRTLTCLFCRASILFQGIPAKRYQSHLMNEHNILFEEDVVIQLTLRRQVPSLAEPQNCECKKSSKDDSALPAGEISSSFPKVLANTVLEVQNNNGQIFPKRERTTDNSFGGGDNFFGWLRSRCSYACGLCPDKWSEMDDFLRHLSDAHKMSLDTHVGLFGDPCEQEVLTDCKFCGEEVRHEQSALKAHIEVSHQLSLIQYFDDYVKGVDNNTMNNSKDNSSSSIKNDGSTSRRLIYQDEDDDIEIIGTVERNQTFSALVKEEPKEAEQDLATTSSSNLSQGGELEKNDIPGSSDGGLKAPWHCGSLYECKICNSQFFEIAELRRHVNTAHEMDLDDVTNFHGNPAVVANIHECEICGRGLLHNYQTIRGHVKIHGHNLSTYYSKFKEELDKASVELPIKDPVLIGRLNKRSTQKNQNETSRDETSETVANQINAHQIDWLNRCTYTCKICPNYQVKSRGTLHSHLRSVHNISGTDYCEEYGSLCTDYVQHVCQICGTTMTWQRDNVSSHLSRHHPSITIEEYVSTYKDSYSEMLVKEDRECEQWLNQCVFECFECNTKFSKKSRLILHLTAEHKLTKEELVRKKHGKFATKTVYMQCKICDKRIMWDSRSIISHLNKDHSMEASEYKEKFVTEEDLKNLDNSGPVGSSSEKAWNDKCSYFCAICFKTNFNKRTFRIHLQSVHDMLESYYTKQFGSTLFEKVSHSCILCDAELLLDSEVLTSHLQKSHSKTKTKSYLDDCFSKYQSVSKRDEQNWTNRCSYYCKLCMSISAGKDQFRRHIITEHSMTNSDYTAQYGSCVLEETFHICQAKSLLGKVCGKEVLWEERSMTHHFAAKHNLTPEEYHKNFMKDYSASRLSNLNSAKENWMKKCSYLCKICSKEFDTKSQFLSHSINAHQIEHPGDSLYRFMLHTCQICDENVTWEEEALKDHLRKGHGIDEKEYSNSYLDTYRESESCHKQIIELDNWMSRCLFKCCLCLKDTFDKKSKLQNHVRGNHKTESSSYFTLYNTESTVTSVTHVCQICCKKVLWDEKSLESHIVNSHKISSAIYRTKYLNDYTEDEEEIARLRKEENKLARASKKANPGSNDSGRDSFIAMPEEESGEGMTDEIRTWAKGCLFCCQICEQDIVGTQPFSLHLSSCHDTSLQNYKKRYSAACTNVIVGYHFCKICCNNVRHDEADLVSHFRKEHKMTIADYFNQFRAKLKMPRLERPAVEGNSSINNSSINNSSINNSSINNSSINSDCNISTKQDQPETESAKKRKKPAQEAQDNPTATDSKRFCPDTDPTDSSNSFGLESLKRVKTEFLNLSPVSKPMGKPSPGISSTSTPKPNVRLSKGIVTKLEFECVDEPLDF